MTLCGTEALQLNEGLGVETRRSTQMLHEPRKIATEMEIYSVWNA